MGLLSTVQYKNTSKILLEMAANLELAGLGCFLAPKFVLSAVRYSVEPEFIHSVL